MQEPRILDDERTRLINVDRPADCIAATAALPAIACVGPVAVERCPVQSDAPFVDIKGATECETALRPRCGGILAERCVKRECSPVYLKAAAVEVDGPSLRGSARAGIDLVGVERSALDSDCASCIVRVQAASLAGNIVEEGDVVERQIGPAPDVQTGLPV